MTEPSNSDIMRVLGRLEAGQDNAQEGRERLERKLDLHGDKLSEVVETQRRQADDIAITSQVASQARDTALQLKMLLDAEVRPTLQGVATFRAEAEPIIENIKTLRKAVLVMIGLLTTGGVLSAGTLVFAGNLFKQIIRAWLELPPLP